MLDKKSIHISCGKILPEGYIKDFMLQHVKSGFFYQFDSIDDTASHRLFHTKNRLSSKLYHGKKCWWSGEHEGYFIDGLVRAAFLLDEDRLQQRMHTYMSTLIGSIDDSGYVGIYANKGLGARYEHTGENGELWTQARIISAMLAYYEFTEKEDILNACIVAVDLTMAAYADKNPFISHKPEGGVSHGIGYLEILYWLNRITKKRKYVVFARKLMTDFSNTQVRDDDLQWSNILDSSRSFKKHGAHIAEGMFIFHWFDSVAPSPKFNRAKKNLLQRLSIHSTASLAMRCDENVRSLAGSPYDQYEYCSLIETVISLNKMTDLTCDVLIADRIESVVFNAAFGARFSDGSALAYLSSDERSAIDHDHLGGRETFDACHEVAACCALNDGRLLPHYVDGQYKKIHDGIVVLLFGPSSFTSMFEDTSICLEQTTSYPFGDEVEFRWSISDPVQFKLYIRKPHGLRTIKVHSIEGLSIDDEIDFVVLDKEWKHGDKVKVIFDFPILVEPFKNQANTVVIRRGPLLFSREIPYEKSVIRSHGSSGFHQYHIKRIGKMTDIKLNTQVVPELIFEPISNVGLINFPIVVRTNGYDGRKPVQLDLVPMGQTILRQVVFNTV